MASMTPRERLMADACKANRLTGRRPGYELNGLDENPRRSRPVRTSFPICPGSPLIDLAREKTDRIVLRGVAFKEITPDPHRPCSDG